MTELSSEGLRSDSQTCERLLMVLGSWFDGKFSFSFSPMKNISYMYRKLNHGSHTLLTVSQVRVMVTMGFSTLVA